MTSIYLDSNVYDHIVKGYVSEEDLAALRAALKEGAITARLSLADIEELLGQWETNRSAAIQRLRLARGLVGFHGMLKEPTDYWTEVVEAYAAASDPPSVTVPEDERRRIVSILVAAASGSTSHDPEISELIFGMKTQKQRFLDNVAEERSILAATPLDAREWSFERFWAAGFEVWAKDFAEAHPLGDACRQRGLNGLIELRPVRFHVGAVISLLYSLVVEERRPAQSDGYDLWHVLMASTADVFVTFDQRLAASLARMPLADFRVVTSLGELLAS